MVLNVQSTNSLVVCVFISVYIIHSDPDLSLFGPEHRTETVNDRYPIDSMLKKKIQDEGMYILSFLESSSELWVYSRIRSSRSVSLSVYNSWVI